MSSKHRQFPSSFPPLREVKYKNPSDNKVPPKLGPFMLLNATKFTDKNGKKSKTEK